MPLDFIESVAENIHLAVWNIAETEELLVNKAFLSANDQQLLETIHHAAKRLEFLAGRCLVNDSLLELNIPYIGMYRNDYGKPELIESDIQISLSHTEDFVVALIAKGNVGIDIEKPQLKMMRIASRLYTAEELAICGEDLKLICKIWSAKEVLFKLFMIGGIDFKQHLEVSHFSNDFTSCLGIIRKDGREERYQLHFKDFGDYLICYNTNLRP